MHTTNQRAHDRYNNYARTSDTNLRAFSEDIDHVFFLDRPTRLFHGVKP
jgi:endonuclease/exonuclease/phosphatase (EEP) superfamily protein YafD